MIIFKNNESNESVTSLTPKQHYVLKWVCGIVYMLNSCDVNNYINSEHNNCKLLRHVYDEGNDEEINVHLIEVGLQSIDYGCYPLCDLPIDIDYYEFMGEEKRVEYENCAKSMGVYGGCGYTLWLDEVTPIFERYLKQIITAINIYLLQTDKKHGTDYVSYSREPIQCDCYDTLNCDGLGTPYCWIE